MTNFFKNKIFNNKKYNFLIITTLLKISLTLLINVL